MYVTRSHIQNRGVLTFEYISFIKSICVAILSVPFSTDSSFSRIRFIFVSKRSTRCEIDVFVSNLERGVQSRIRDLNPDIFTNIIDFELTKFRYPRDC